MNQATEAVEVTQVEYIVGNWRVADGIFPDNLIWENVSTCGAEVINVGMAVNAHEARKVVARHNAARLASPAGQGDREAVARLIQPAAFDVDPPHRKDSEGKASARAHALETADAILALKPDTRASGADGLREATQYNHIERKV